MYNLSKLVLACKGPFTYPFTQIAHKAGFLHDNGLSQNPFTHFGIISPEREPTWYVPFRLLIIQNRLVHRNRSFLGIVTIFVWNTNTVFSTTNIFYFWCRCRSTKVIVCLCFCSSAHIARNRLSSNSSKLFLADSF